MVRIPKVRNIALGVEVAILAALAVRLPFLWPALCLVLLGYIPAKRMKK